MARWSSALSGKEKAVSDEGDKNPATPATPLVAPTPAIGVAPSAVAAPPSLATSPRSFFERYRTYFIVGLLVLAAIAAGFGLGRLGKSADKNVNRLVLYGNVDLRQIDLAFNNSERIAEVLVQEGAKVTRGQVLARLETSRLKPQMEAAEAVMQAQQAVVEKLHHGSRPQEIAQAQATVASAQADQVNSRQQWARLAALTTLTNGRAISKEDLDSAKAAMDSAQAHLVAAEKGLDLSRLGPRKEDVNQAEAQLRADQFQLEIRRRQLADSNLVAPCDAVVRSRLSEPGEMASPQKPVLNLAVVDPKWIRAYVSESDLGRIQTGMRASISTDSFPGQVLSGWVGFIASVAEFTPKSVQTEELRSSLVYEIRVFVKDPQDELRLGMPASVLLELDPSALSKS
ncbi:MAG: efflux RND transporter periplasmic adaptor subunit [Thiobacillaceae bacterium]